MDDIDATLSIKAKEYLNRKLIEFEKKIKKLKQKRKMIKALYYSSLILSVSLSGVTATLSGLTMLPIFIIPILSTTSGILTGLSAKFNLQNKKIEISKTIDKIHKIQEKLDYIISCNGNLTEEDLKEIISEISIL